MQTTDLDTQNSEAAARPAEPSWTAALDGMADATGDLIVAMNHDGTYCYCCRAAGAILGRSREDVIGLDNRALGVPQDMIDRFDRERNQVYTGTENPAGDFEFTGVNGTRQYSYRWQLIPALDPDVSVAVFIARDISDTRSVEDTGHFLVRLGERLRAIADPERVIKEAATAVGEYLHLDNCLYAEVEVETGNGRVVEEFRGLIALPASETRPGIFGMAIPESMREGRTLAIEDISADARTVADPDSFWSHLGGGSILIVPLVKEGRLVSFLAAHRRIAQRWSREAVIVLEAVAERSWLAVENARLIAELRAQARLSDALRRAIGLMSAELNAQLLARTIVGEAVELCGAEYAAYWHAPDGEGQDDDGTWTVTGSVDGLQSVWPRRVGKSPRPRAAWQLRIIRSADASSDPALGDTGFELIQDTIDVSVRSYLSLPVVAADGTVCGVLFLGHSRPGLFSTAQEESLMVLCAHAAVAFDNARLYREARHEIVVREAAEGALRERAGEIEALMDLIPAAVWISHDAECRTIRGNRASAQMLRMPDTSNMSISAPPDEREAHFRVYRGGVELLREELPMEFAVAHNCEVRHTEIEIVLPDGTSVFAFGSAVPLHDDRGNVRGCVGAFVDVSEQKRYREHIEKLNDQLHRSMTETHHRVKNGLQQISALIDMSMPETGSFVDASELVRLNSQVRTLASVHEILTYQARDDQEGSTISTRSLLTRLLPMLRSMTGRQIDFEVDDLRLPSRRATSVALVVNELVLNSLKHGTGAVNVTLKVEGAKARLTVSDDGPVEAPAAPQPTGGIGRELVEGLVVRDLNGSVVYGVVGPDGQSSSQIEFEAS